MMILDEKQSLTSSFTFRLKLSDVYLLNVSFLFGFTDNIFVLFTYTKSRNNLLLDQIVKMGLFTKI